MLRHITTTTFQGRLHLVGVGCVTLAFFLLLGLVFQFDLAKVPTLQFAWPAIALLPGAFLMVAGVFRSHAGNFMSRSGGVLIVTGLILLLQDSLASWASWLYAWALALPFAVGVADIIQGFFTRQTTLFYRGIGLATCGLSAFIVGFFIFEIILNISGISPFSSAPARVLTALVIIVLGGYLLARILNDAEEMPIDPM